MRQNTSATQYPALKEWVADVESKLQNVSIPVQQSFQNKCSIFKIPEGFRNPHREGAYKPKLVSFGPYHRRKSQLKPMEEHKQRAVIHFLGRVNKHIHDCVAAVDGVVQQLMDYYDQLDEEWRDRGSFLQLMILDGCFMLEIFRSSNPQFSNEYEANDPIFGKHARVHKLPHIKRDILMIENQLPLLLLKTLLDFETGSPQDDKVINSTVMKFFDPSSSTSIMGQCLHVLDLVRKSMLQGKMHQEGRMCSLFKPSMYLKIFDGCRSAPENEQSKREVIWPATQLRESGIRFKSSRTQNLKCIKFEKGLFFFPGTLSLPEIEVDDATESKFLNLIAFEQLHVDTSSEVSSYVSFMDNIIDKEADVFLLSKKKIIKNFVGTDQAVAELFNGLAYDVAIDPDSSLEKVEADVINFCNNPFCRSLAKLRHTHFKSPWSFISLVAAIFLLCLTVTQTIYSVADFYRHEGDMA